MFPEYTALIEKLKTTDSYFLHLFEKHHILDDKIKSLETHAQLGTPEEIETLKKEKLNVKDQLYTLLRKADVASA